MHGTGVPIATPFDESGAIDHAGLSDLATWLEAEGIDFLVPCGSTGEAPLLTPEERAEVIETVVEATDLPVLAGTGHEGYRQTLQTTERAADAGADGALVVTPSYYNPEDDDLEAYYRDLADAASLPIYLYSVPPFTGHALSPSTAASLATHENVAGIKDSSGDLESIQRLIRETDEEFSVFVGAGSVYAASLDAGADGGILALGNAVPGRASEIYRRHREGDHAGARELNASLVDLNRTMVACHGVPGVKAALDLRGQPVGKPRRPLRSADDDARRDLEAVLENALEA
ncbi:4-hydroxy-tetrahydrodipicolinate synthase [Natrialbaceae archaeon A-gly3]